MTEHEHDGQDDVELEAERPLFAMIPYWVGDAVSDKGLRLYYLLKKKADNDSGKVRTTRRALAKHLGWSPSTFDTTAKELEALGAVTVHRKYDAEAQRWSPNRYRVMFNAPGSSELDADAEQGVQAARKRATDRAARRAAEQGCTDQPDTGGVPEHRDRGCTGQPDRGVPEAHDASLDPRALDPTSSRSLSVARRRDSTDANGTGEEREGTEGRTANPSAEGLRDTTDVSTSPSARPSSSARAATSARATSATKPTTRANARRDANASPDEREREGPGAWPSSELQSKGRRAAEAYGRFQSRRNKGEHHDGYARKCTASAMEDARFVQLVTKHPDASPESLADKYVAVRFGTKKARPGPPPPPVVTARPVKRLSPEALARVKARGAEIRAERERAKAEKGRQEAEDAAHTAAGAPEGGPADGRVPGIDTDQLGTEAAA